MAGGDWRKGGFTEREPSPAALSWVTSALGAGSRIVGHRRLTGGVSSAMTRLTVERSGVQTAVVLRQYPAGLGLDVTMTKEVDNLGVVAGSGLPVPTVIAADVAGASTDGEPSLLMTQLPGHLELDPAEPRAWLTEIAQLAATLHALDLPAEALAPWSVSWIAPLDTSQVPLGARDPAVWTTAFAVLTTPPPSYESVFLHGDFLPVNLLWSGGKITGVADWNSIRRGSRAVDLGHCRRYLAALGTPEWSEQLRSLYESIAGVALDPWWDLYALLHHDDSQPTWIRRQVAGLRPVDAAGMTARVEVALTSTLRRLG